MSNSLKASLNSAVWIWSKSSVSYIITKCHKKAFLLYFSLWINYELLARLARDSGKTKLQGGCLVREYLRLRLVMRRWCHVASVDCPRLCRLTPVLSPWNSCEILLNHKANVWIQKIKEYIIIYLHLTPKNLSCFICTTVRKKSLLQTWDESHKRQQRNVVWLKISPYWLKLLSNPQKCLFTSSHLGSSDGS